MTPVRDEAERFLRALGGSITFQTFDDRKRKPDRFAKWMHGTLAEHFNTLVNLNARGAGVFVMVNEGDSKGRSTRNMQRIRAYFADFDNAAPPPVESTPLRPHCVIESSPGRWHWYWFVEGAPLDTFKAVQVAIAQRYGSDASVIDLCRVMRLPGFLHRKREPFLTQIAELRNVPRYTHSQFVETFGIDLNAEADTVSKIDANRKHRASVTRLPMAQHHKRTLADTIPEGERNYRLFSLARGLVQKGFDAQGVNDRLQRINAERCKPPLGADEVDTIAARAVAYGSEGFTILPDKLLDSPEWRALAPPAHDVILTAFRRYNGANADDIALTWADFEGKPGFGRKHTFYRHRARAVASGILRNVEEARNTQTGRKPDLFAIAPQWLHNPPVSILKPCASVENVHPYIDKQSLEALAAGSQQNRKTVQR